MNLRATYHAPGFVGLKKPDSSGASEVARELHSRAMAEARAYLHAIHLLFFFAFLFLRFFARGASLLRPARMNSPSTGL